MALTLQIITKPNDVLLENSIKEFVEEGGSIGRAEHCDLSLPDDSQYISKIHALIHFRDNMYFITDVSTNGVYVNSESIPIGKGNTKQILEGEKLRIGDYVMQATFVGATEVIKNNRAVNSVLNNNAEEVDEIEALLRNDDDISDLLAVEVNQHQIKKSSIIDGDELSIDDILNDLNGKADDDLIEMNSSTNNDDAIADLLDTSNTSHNKSDAIDVMADLNSTTVNDAVFNAVLAEIDNFAVLSADSAIDVEQLKQYLLAQKDQIIGSS
jgi:type VI secretion system FHA domain protein